MDPEVREGLARSWKGLMIVGVLAIVVGCVAILVPEVASVGTAIFIGWVLLVAGAFLVAAAFSAHSVGSLLVRMLWAVLTVAVGVWLIVEPHNGTLTLTLVLGIYFLFMGLTRITVAFLGRGQPNAGLVGLRSCLKTRRLSRRWREPGCESRSISSAAVVLTSNPRPAASSSSARAILSATWPRQ